MHIESADDGDGLGICAFAWGICPPEVTARSGGQIDSQSEVGAWPSQPSANRPFEIPPDPHGDDDGDGYTNIEELIHSM